MTGPYENASDDDRERFGMLLYRMFTSLSDAYRFGRMDSDLMERSQNYLDRFLRYPAVQGWWSRQGYSYSGTFQSVVEGRLRAVREKEEA